jgi:hypothetical protein
MKKETKCNSVNLTRIPKEDHIPTEQVEATKLERVIVYTTPRTGRLYPPGNIHGTQFC